MPASVVVEEVNMERSRGTRGRVGNPRASSRLDAVRSFALRVLYLENASADANACERLFKLARFLRNNVSRYQDLLGGKLLQNLLDVLDRISSLEDELARVSQLRRVALTDERRETIELYRIQLSDTWSQYLADRVGYLLEGLKEGEYEKGRHVSFARSQSVRPSTLLSSPLRPFGIRRPSLAIPTIQARYTSLSSHSSTSGLLYWLGIRKKDRDTSLRDAIIALRHQLAILKSKEEDVQAQIWEYMERARLKVASNTEGALAELRHKKVQEITLSRLVAIRSRIQFLLDSIEVAEINAETLRSLKRGVKVLKGLNRIRGQGAEGVEKLIEAINEERKIASEATNVVAELNSLDGEVFETQEVTVNQRTRPFSSGSSAQADHLVLPNVGYFAALCTSLPQDTAAEGGQEMRQTRLRA